MSSWGKNQPKDEKSSSKDDSHHDSHHSQSHEQGSPTSSEAPPRSGSNASSPGSSTPTSKQKGKVRFTPDLVDGPSRGSSAASGQSSGPGSRSQSSTSNIPPQRRHSPSPGPPGKDPFSNAYRYPPPRSLLRVRSPLSSPPATHDAEDYFSSQGSGRHSAQSTPALVLTGPDEQSNKKATVENTLRNGGNDRFNDMDVRHQHNRSYGGDTDHESDSSVGSDNRRGRRSASFYLGDQPRSRSSSRNIEPDAPPPAALHHHLGNILDVGLKTSGGLAPGATSYDDDSDRSNSGQEPSLLERRRGTLGQLNFDKLHPRQVSEPNSAVATPYHEGEEGIPLEDLDKKLTDLQNNLHSDAQEAARLLVQSHIQKAKIESARRNKDAEKSAHAGGDQPVEYDKDHGYVVPNPKALHRANTLKHEKSNDSENKDNEKQGDEEDYSNEVNTDGERTPIDGDEYIAPPKQLRQGVLGSLLKLYADNDRDSNRSSTTLGGSTPNSGASTPGGQEGGTPSGARTPGGSSLNLAALKPKIYRTGSDEGHHRQKWYKHKSHSSTSSLGNLLVGAANTLAAPATGSRLGSHEKHEQKDNQSNHGAGPSAKKKKALAAAKKKKQERLAEQARITVHIADVLQRQRFILRICKALMLFGAPTHRLEEYLKMTARVLEIDGQFIYMPGCMIVSFGDTTTHTSDMQIVRCTQGLNLSKLHETHLIYKEVVHDLLGVEEAGERIEHLLGQKNLYPKWLCVVFFGISSAMCTMYAFGGGWSDLGISVFLSSIVAVLQIYIAPKSSLYSNVFEVSASIVVSFLGRAFGSIGHEVFCFSAITQGSLALILPGYIILCGSLELQSRNLVAGSVRMFYAIVYSMFLGFGITLGAAIYGWIDKNAVSTLACKKTADDRFRILFVPLFSMFVAMVNQASVQQLPIMMLIGSSGYTVTYFMGKRISGASEFTSAIGAFVIGILGNIYSRIGHGLAFAAMLPAIFLQVPSGVASQGSLISGVQTANQLVHKNSTSSNSSNVYSSGMQLGATMIQVSVGITVGLFAATLVVYPLGKKRSGLFTF